MKLSLRRIRDVIQDICYSAARKWGCQPQEVLDDVCADVQESLAKQRSIEKVDRYLRTCAYHQSIRVCRQLATSKVNAEDALNIGQVESPESDPLSQLIRAEEHELLEREMKRLDRRSRRAVNSFFQITPCKLQRSDYYLKDKALKKLRRVLLGKDAK